MPENPLFTDEYIDKLKRAAERYFTTNIKILFRRKAIDIVEGQDIYKLPNDITDLVGVHYKGKIISPGNVLSGRDKSLIAFTNRNVIGVPMYYFLKEYEYDIIRLWPKPSETLVANQNIIDYDYGISSQCIISYYQVATEEDQLPSFLRRRLVKYYVMKFAYQKEGNSQNLKAAVYFDSKLQWAMDELQSFIRDCSGARYYSMAAPLNKYSIPRPILPPNFPVR